MWRIQCASSSSDSTVAINGKEEGGEEDEVVQLVLFDQVIDVVQVVEGGQW